MEEEDGEDMPSRPSAPATLFDFLTNKIPTSKEGGETTYLFFHNIIVAFLWLKVSRAMDE